MCHTLISSYNLFSSVFIQHSFQTIKHCIQLFLACSFRTLRALLPLFLQFTLFSTFPKIELFYISAVQDLNSSPWSSIQHHNESVYRVYYLHLCTFHFVCIIIPNQVQQAEGFFEMVILVSIACPETSSIPSMTQYRPANVNSIHFGWTHNDS